MTSAAERYLWLRRRGRGYGPITGWSARTSPSHGRRWRRCSRPSMRSAAATAWRSRWSRMPGTATCIRCCRVPKHPGDGGRAAARLHGGADELVRAALRLGGTISGEHGVGITKTPLDGLGSGQGNLGSAAQAEGGRSTPTRDPEPAHLARRGDIGRPRPGTRDISEAASPSMTPATYGENRA